MYISHLNRLRFFCLFSVFLIGCNSSESPRAISVQNEAKSEDSTSPEQTQPEILLTHDFDSMTEGEVVEHQFEITNNQSYPVEYSQYRVSCHCLSITSKPGPIAGGSKGRITLKLETHGVQGRVTQRAMFFSDDKRVPPLTLSVTGIVAGIWASPAVISFGDLKLGSQSSQSFLVAASAIRGAKVLSVETSSKAIEATFQDVLPTEEARAEALEPFSRVTLRWPGNDVPPGPFETKATVTTNISQFQKIDVPITGYVVGAVQLSPPKLVFGNVKPGMTVVRTSRIIGGDSSLPNVESLDLKSEDGLIHGAISDHKAGAAEGIVLTVTLAVPADAKPGLVKGDLIAHIEGRTYFSIPYVAFVR